MGCDDRWRPWTGGRRGATCVIRPPVAPVAVRRGEVWWVNRDPTRGSEIRKTRPADGPNRARRTVVVVPLSRGPAPRPPIVVATPSAGAGCVAVCDQVRAIDKGRLIRCDGQLAPGDLQAIEAGVRAILELQATTPASPHHFRIYVN
jgi:mRNA interferase MazF